MFPHSCIHLYYVHIYTSNYTQCLNWPYNYVLLVLKTVHLQAAAAHKRAAAISSRLAGFTDFCLQSAFLLLFCLRLSKCTNPLQVHIMLAVVVVGGVRHLALRQRSTNNRYKISITWFLNQKIKIWTYYKTGYKRCIKTHNETLQSYFLYKTS